MPPDDVNARIEAKLDMVVACLMGDLRDGTTGLVSRVARVEHEQARTPDLTIRIDRLEQRENARHWWARAAGVAGLSGLVTAVAAFLKGTP